MAELLLVGTTSSLDLRDLVRAFERQGDAGSVTAAPGLLTPAGEGLVRDAARERGATVAVCVPGNADTANHALLTVEAARAAGLVVPVVVVLGHTGLDQRELLAAYANADVFHVTDPQAPSADVVGFPVADWLQAEPLALSGGVALVPYTAWEEHAVPDPRTAGREAIGPVLLELVHAEGPVLAERAYRLYVRASGGKALTSIARAPLSGAAFRLRQAGAIEFEGEDEQLTLRPAGTPPVRVRELGPRALDEVPQAELGELMRRLSAAGTAPGDLPRAVLDTYGLVRMTAKAEQLLAEARAAAGLD